MNDVSHTLKQFFHVNSVGLKMNLLDPTQSIDLQYLGVRLPIPPPGVSLEPLTQELPASQGSYHHTDQTQAETRRDILSSEWPSETFSHDSKSINLFCFRLQVFVQHLCPEQEKLQM